MKRPTATGTRASTTRELAPLACPRMAPAARAKPMRPMSRPAKADATYRPRPSMDRNLRSAAWCFRAGAGMCSAGRAQHAPNRVVVVRTNGTHSHDGRVDHKPGKRLPARQAPWPPAGIPRLPRGPIRSPCVVAVRVTCTTCVHVRKGPPLFDRPDFGTQRSGVQIPPTRPQNRRSQRCPLVKPATGSPTSFPRRAWASGLRRV
jgi:hypothetical protein